MEVVFFLINPARFVKNKKNMSGTNYSDEKKKPHRRSSARVFFLADRDPGRWIAVWIAIRIVDRIIFRQKP